MNKGDVIERPKGGKDIQDLTQQERIDRKSDIDDFQIAIINDDYTKKLKSKSNENVYLERAISRLHFTNSCWEIQRVNALRGGNLILDEVYRMKHLGTGKYLNIAEDKQELVLLNNANSLSTLFTIRSDMNTKKSIKYLDQDADGVIGNYRLLESGQRIMIK